MTLLNKLSIKITLMGGIILSCGLAMAQESTDPIKIVLNNWSSQQVLAHVSGELLKRSGYHVEYHPADAQLQYQAIGSGDLHFQVEVWQGTMAMPFEQQVARKRMIDAGTHDAVTREEWWYPEHMELICPGLPDWKALNRCAEKLATPVTKPRGRYLAGPVDWERPDRERIEALDLKFDVVNVTNPMSMWAELDAAVRSNRPILLMNWTPNWVDAKYPGKFVEFPAYHADCETTASWGDNPRLTHDCGNPTSGWLKKGVWSGFPGKWSCAFEMVENINFNSAQITTAAAYAEVDEMSPEQAALRWIEENPQVWKQWIPGCTDTLTLTASTTVAATKKDATTETSAETGALAKNSGCLNCHGIDNKIVGPSFKDVAAKYRGDKAAAGMLFDTVKNGGSGNWGAIPMPPNPGVSEQNIKTLIEWVLSLDGSQ